MMFILVICIFILRMLILNVFFIDFRQAKILIYLLFPYNINLLGLLFIIFKISFI